MCYCCIERYTSVDEKSTLPVNIAIILTDTVAHFVCFHICMYFIFVCVCLCLFLFFFFRSNIHLTTAIPPLRVGQLNSHRLLCELSTREKNLRKMLEGKKIQSVNKDQWGAKCI